MLSTTNVCRKTLRKLAASPSTLPSSLVAIQPCQGQSGSGLKDKVTVIIKGVLLVKVIVIEKSLVIVVVIVIGTVIVKIPGMVIFGKP